MSMRTCFSHKLAAAAAVTLAVSGVAHAQNTPVPLETWQRAADPHVPGWSREALLRQMSAGLQFEALDRQEILARFGPPGFATESYYPGEGLTHRSDLYRLTAKNDHSFRVNYKPSGKVESAATETTPCACPLCRDLAGNTDIILQDAVVTDFLTNTLVSGDHPSIGLAELEGLVGHPGKRSSRRAAAGEQVWVDYEVTWRIAGGGGEHFLIGSGHISARDWDSYEGARIETYDLITLTEECEAP